MSKEYYKSEQLTKIWRFNPQSNWHRYTNKVTIDKGNGKTRKIYPPTTNFKKYLKEVTPELVEYYEQKLLQEELSKVDKAVIGFRPGKNIVIGAKQHIGFNYTISMDLTDFFDNCRYINIKEYFANDKDIVESKTIKQFKHKKELKLTNNPFSPSIISRRFIFKQLMVDKRKWDYEKRHLPQGFNSSPVLSNLAFLKTDILILKELEEKIEKECGDTVVYTRYADDITISCNNKESIDKIISIVKSSIQPKYKNTNYGQEVQLLSGGYWEINKKKTKIYSSKRGNRTILGISVGDTDIYPSRYIKRKLRAATHQNNENSIQGLSEYMLLKEAK